MLFIIINMFFLTAVITCGLIDYKKYIIPNAITVPLIAVGLVMQIYYQNWINIIFALVIGLMTLILVTLTGGMGGGDIKLIVALFLWLSPADCLNIVIASSIIGIIWGVARKIKVMGYQHTKDEYIQKLITLRVIGIKGIENQDVTKNKYEIVPFGTCIALTTVFFYCYVILLYKHL